MFLSDEISAEERKNKDGQYKLSCSSHLISRQVVTFTHHPESSPQKNNTISIGQGQLVWAHLNSVGGEETDINAGNEQIVCR